ncbi:hypothetical protein ACM53I_004208 [Enterobacter hormaechei]|uniref:hypothetical protein n=1 Tax=Enterobacter hormaechei TaxID=158836 RepID=UPI0022EC8BE0|nr:hypothetical protein [Enterobacter hormaechei]WBT25762.1 hypothetical protein PF325_11210 [Enterobacter hormaechei]
MKQKFIEWFTKGNNGCAPSINADGSFEHEKTQHMFEAYQAGMAESDRKVEQLAAENACLKQSIEEVAEAFETGTDGALATAVDESLNLLTPETDAVLKRIQAQGVAVFASKCKEESKRAHSSDARDSWWVSGENADDFAAQLRQEAAK